LNIFLLVVTFYNWFKNKIECVICINIKLTVKVSIVNKNSIYLMNKFVLINNKGVYKLL
jgi:hypothetical protein